MADTLPTHFAIMINGNGPAVTLDASVKAAVAALIASLKAAGVTVDVANYSSTQTSNLAVG